MTFTDDLWGSIGPTFDSILAHPFLDELCSGRLTRERFVFYMQQDALYLKDFSRALATIAARASERRHQESFLTSATNALVVERALHETFFQEYGVQGAEVAKSPACFAYTNYLIALAAAGSYAEAAAGVLPCFWIYLEVGRHLRDRAASALETNPYRRWIETYASEGFEAGVRRTIGVIDEIAVASSEDDRGRMREAFAAAARLEWMFWDSAHRLEQWPP